MPLPSEAEWPDVPPLTVTIVNATDSATQILTENAADPADVPMHIEWSTQNPGGFGDASFTLARPLQPWATDTGVYSDVTITAETYVGSETKWMGRIKGISQVDTEEIRVECEGESAKLDDDESFRFLGVHSDLSAWQGTPRTRQQALLFTGVYPANDIAVEMDTTGLDVLAVRLTAPWASAMRSEAWLWVDGIPIGEMRVYWRNSIFVDDADDANWETEVGLTNDDVTIEHVSSELTNVDGNTTLAATGDQYAVLMFAHNSTKLVDEGKPYEIFFVPQVFGTHGLTPILMNEPPKPEDLTALQYGLLGSQILEYAVPQAVPGISASQVADSDYVIPHLVHGPAPVRELIEAVTAYGDTNGDFPDWGIYEGGFFWTSPGSIGETWTVRKDEVARPLDEGPSAEEICYGVVVRYQDPGGRAHTVGPPGADVETEDATLADATTTAPTNRIKYRDVGLTTQAGAILIGRALLAEQNAKTRKGSVTITGYAETPSGAIKPAMDVRACDTVEVEDQDADEHIPVVTTSYSHDELTCTVSLGSAPHRIDILLARLASASTLVGA
jgi:hypothetical protein